MGERLFFLWLRFRWLIVIGTVLVAVGGGVAAQMVELPSRSNDAATAEGSALGSTGGTLEAGSLLEECAELENDDERYTCRTNLPAAMPIVLDADRSNLLGPGGWLKLDGQGVASAATGLTTADLEVITSGFTTDLDNDGYPEHVLVTGAAGSGVLRILSGSDAANMRDTAGARGLAAGAGARIVLPVDANEDGWTDIVVAYGRSASSAAASVRGVRIYLNAGWEGPGIFRADDVVQLSTTLDDVARNGRYLQDPVDGTATDLDADGHVDLVFVDQRSVMGIYWGDGSTTVEEAIKPSILRVPMGVTGLALSDVDEDGRTDVVVSYDIGMGSAGRALCLPESNNRPCTVYPGQSPQGGIAVLTQGDGRSFTPNEALSVVDVTYASAVAVLDLDGDGDKEIVLGREPLEDDGSGNVVVYEAVLADGRVVGYTLSALRLPEDIEPVGRITSGDVDGNGSIDLLLTGRGEKRLQTWVNPNAEVRTLRLRVDGSAGFETLGTARGAIGAIVTVTDVDDRQVRVVVDVAAMQTGVTVVLPLESGAWSGTEAVPQVEVLFPATGRRVELKNVATDRIVSVVEPAK